MYGWHGRGNHFSSDIDRLRDLAAAGMNVTAAGHELGHTASWSRYWAQRRGIHFELGKQGYLHQRHPMYADLAAAKVRHLMDALRS